MRDLDERNSKPFLSFKVKNARVAHGGKLQTNPSLYYERVEMFSKQQLSALLMLADDPC